MSVSRSGQVRNVVLVHGACADGSSWSGVIARLQAAGLVATAVQNPLGSLADDVAHTRRILAMQDGPTILAGHSFAGTVITEVGTDPRVVGLVYIATRAPDVGEDYGALASRFPTPPANAGLVYDHGFGGLTEDAFLNDFANGVDPVKARTLYAVQAASPKLFSRRGSQWRRVAVKAMLVRQRRSPAARLRPGLLEAAGSASNCPARTSRDFSVLVEADHSGPGLGWL